MDNATIFKLLDQQREELKDLMVGQSALISARVDAKIDQKFGPVEADLKALIEHKDRQNGWIKEHTEKLEKHDNQIVNLEKKDISIDNYQINCPANKLALKISRKNFRILLALEFILAFFILATIYHELGFGRLIRALIDSLL